MLRDKIMLGAVEQFYTPKVPRKPIEPRYTPRWKSRMPKRCDRLSPCTSTWMLKYLKLLPGIIISSYHTPSLLRRFGLCFDVHTDHQWITVSPTNLGLHVCRAKETLKEYPSTQAPFLCCPLCPRQTFSAYDGLFWVSFLFILFSSFPPGSLEEGFLSVTSTIASSAKRCFLYHEAS